MLERIFFFFGKKGVLLMVLIFIYIFMLSFHYSQRATLKRPVMLF